MPAFGGYASFPLRFGGGPSPVQVLHQALNQARGTAYDTSPGTVVSIYNLARAKAVAVAYATNERVSNLWNPARMGDDVVERWRTILAWPDRGETPWQTRARLVDHFALFVEEVTHGLLVTRLERALGPFFVDVEYIDATNAVVHAPSVDWAIGTVVEGIPWSSTSMRMLVRLQKPAGATEAAFYDAAGKVSEILGPLLPAWETFDWYRAPTSGTPTVVIGGPSAAGFYLDAESNLDNNVFD